MTDTSTRERFGRNASEIAGAIVTGTWLAALLLDFGWWLPFMLFGYMVIVPVVSMLFDEDEETESVGRTERESVGETDDVEQSERVPDAIARLRARYAEGELTDEQFERKLDRLLETETPEDAAAYVERNDESGSDAGRGSVRDIERER